MSVPAYESYRDSGVEWLGVVPSHWKVTRLKTLFEVKKRIVGCGGFEVFSITQRGFRVRDVESLEGQVAESYDNYQLVEPGDFAMNSMDLLTGGVDIAQSVGVTSPDYRVASMRAGAGVPSFFLYAFQNCYRRRIFYAFGQGASQLGRWRLSTDAFYQFNFPLPPATEQAALAAFLDRETGKIDALVEEQRRLIALLKEKRQAVISHAVTKGLNQSAPMKDSGVEWLGEVPAHWTVAPLKRFLSVLSGWAFPSSGFSANPADVRLLRGVNVGVGEIKWDEVVYWARQEGDGLEGWKLNEGDVVIGMDRPWISSGLRVARIGKSDLPCLLLQRVAALRPGPSVEAEYLPYLLQGEAFQHHCVPEMTGVSVPHISPTQIGDFLVAMPADVEQAEILQHVQQVETSSARLVSTAERAIELLQERRAALISAAVTGKIDVRGLAPAKADAA